MEYLDAEISTSGESTLKRMTTASSLLEVAVHSKGSLFIIIDGLDECIKKEKKDIISWVRSLASKDKKNISEWGGETGVIRWLLVGQEDSECTKLLKGCQTIKIQPADNNNDIHAFCQLKENELREKHSRLQVPGTQITRRVVEEADGKLSVTASQCLRSPLTDISQACFFSQSCSWSTFSLKRKKRMFVMN